MKLSLNGAFSYLICEFANKVKFICGKTSVKWVDLMQNSNDTDIIIKVNVIQ